MRSHSTLSQVSPRPLSSPRSAIGGMALAATAASKDEAVAMVKKAVSAIKAEGPGKAYPEISNPSGKFVDGDLYIVVYGLDGMVLAHGADAKRIGTNQLADKDPDGKAFVKERVRARRDASELLAELQIHEPGDAQGRAEGHVLRAAGSDRGVRRRLSALSGRSSRASASAAPMARASVDAPR